MLWYGQNLHYTGVPSFVPVSTNDVQAPTASLTPGPAFVVPVSTASTPCSTQPRSRGLSLLEDGRELALGPAGQVTTKVPKIWGVIIIGKFG